MGTSLNYMNAYVHTQMRAILHGAHRRRELNLHSSNPLLSAPVSTRNTTCCCQSCTLYVLGTLGKGAPTRGGGSCRFDH